MVLTEWRHTGVERKSAKVIENFPVRLFLQRRAHDCDARRPFIFHSESKVFSVPVSIHQAVGRLKLCLTKVKSLACTHEAIRTIGRFCQTV